MSATLHRTEGSADADRWNAVVQLAHQLDDAAQHITERQAYDFATQFRVLAGIDGEQAAATAAAVLNPATLSLSGWQPIETAPKDGTGVLLTNGKDVSQGWWVHEEPYIREQRDVAGVYIDQQEHDGFDGWMDCDGGMQPDPTLWMPLPLPPAPNQGEAS